MTGRTPPRRPHPITPLPSARRVPGSATPRSRSPQARSSQTRSTQTRSSQPPATRDRRRVGASTTARAGTPRRRPPTKRTSGRVRAVRPGVRLRGGAALLTLALLALVARLLWLQGLGGTAYAAQAKAQRVRTTVVPAVRGEILDRNGGVLAQDIDARAVFADPSLVRKDGNAVDEAAELAPVLGLDATTLAARMSLPGRFAYLAHDVTPALAARVDALTLPGVATQHETERIYPNGALGADVIGFTDYNDQGVAGIEAARQAQLQGIAGSTTTQVAYDGVVIPGAGESAQAAVPGASVQLTLDPNIQWEAQQAIASQVAKYHAQSGSVIVLNPKNGQVLADAVAPTFDASDPGAAPSGATGNVSVSGVYEPGSVNKVIVAAAALQSRILTPTSVLDIPSHLEIGGSDFHDAEGHGDEKLTFTGVLAKSSNVGAIEIAQRLGNATVAAYLRSFGFGQPTGVGLPGESAGDVPPVASWGPTTAATIPFGQGLDVTAMQVAAAYGAVANGGMYVQPQVVSATIAPDGKKVLSPAPATHRVVAPGVAATLRTMLEQVTTENGTAPAAAISGYRIAGKTGTANAIGANGRYSGYTSSFVGMAPADDPQLVVEVVLVRPHGNIYGGTVAGPVFQRVMSFALQSLRIPPSTTKAPTIPLGG